MALKEPCPDGIRDYYPDYDASGPCNAYCRWSEFHCRKCGWYISTCPCGDNKGMSKLSARGWQAIERQRDKRITAEVSHATWDALYH